MHRTTVLQTTNRSSLSEKRAPVLKSGRVSPAVRQRFRSYAENDFGESGTSFPWQQISSSRICSTSLAFDQLVSTVAVLAHPDQCPEDLGVVLSLLP